MKRIALLAAAALSVAAASAAKHADRALAAMCEPQSLEEILPQPRAFAPVPKGGDAYWRDSVPQAMRADFIARGEQHLGLPWPSLDVELFSQFRRTGDRVGYETFIFDKRKRLGDVVMAEIMEGEGRFLPTIANGVQSLCDETWWGIPAHYGPESPRPEQQPLALFSAETGAMAAWIYYMLGDKLAEQYPNLTERLASEIKRRVLDEALNRKEWWRGAGMNWNPWICSNWLACALFVEPDRDRQVQAVAEIAQSLDGFIDQYPDDGGCDEGSGYWDRAAGSLLDALALLDAATQGQVSLKGDDKVKAMAEYICLMDVGNGRFVNFADAVPDVFVRPEWLAGAVAVGSDRLASLSAQAAQASGYGQHPSAVFQKDNFGPLGRELMLLGQLSTLQGTQGQPNLAFDAWLPRVEVVAARSVPNSAESLYFAAKGGHNNESHNHNDVGSFIVYADGQPLFVDPGRATYTGKSFTSRRYEQWNTQSGYHNVPIINGCMQSPGAEYKAVGADAKFTNKQARFTLDIAPAYPAEAGVESYVRSIDLQRGKSLEITDRCSLEQPGEVQVVFMSPSRPIIEGGKATYTLDGKKWTLAFPATMQADCQEMDIDDPYVAHSWGPKFYRLILSANLSASPTTLKFKISN